MRDARFASDNAAGVHPEVMAAIVEANDGAALAYGADPWTARAEVAIRRVLDAPEAGVWLVPSGTGANVLALRAVTGRIDGVLCADTAHLHRSETGAPELTAGVKLLTVPAVDGRLTPRAVRAAIPPRDGDHAVRPAVLSITQATEWGTVYTPAEVAALAEVAHAHGMLLHVDGARLANAAVALDTSLAALTTHAGVDLVSLGGTKNGALAAEAVVFLRPGLGKGAGRHRKQITQLVSKMRFVGAQLSALYAGDLWWRCAAHANHQAQALSRAVVAVSGVRLALPVSTNAVFVELPVDLCAPLAEHFAFELWDPARRIARWMTAWDTTEGDIRQLVGTMRALRGEVDDEE
ncbi:MAG: threonine aldolase [Alphaproteobacteria bacterium]|nr:threonine aldolase [Alphaproteobacteria bacterium]